MYALALLGLAVVGTFLHLLFTGRDNLYHVVDTFLSYILLFCVGILGFLGFYAHVFDSQETAQLIGWLPSPFQYEMGMTNLAIGILGVLSFWLRDNFRLATVIAYFVIFVGCFIGHLIEFFKGNTAPYNIGIAIWLTDLIIPFIVVSLLGWLYRNRSETVSH